jgi:cytochrome c oxidase subunit 4
MGGSHADVSKHVKAYYGVFGALAVLTIVTVAVAQYHFSDVGNVVVALIIAAFKASLVAAIFMHLKWERSHAVWWSLAICGVLFIVLIFIPVLTSQDHPPQALTHMWDMTREAPPAPAGH